MAARLRPRSGCRAQVVRLLPSLLLALSTLTVVVGCTADQPAPQPSPSASPSAGTPAPGSSATPVTTATSSLRVVRVEPVSGFVGDSFRVAVDGLPPGAAVEWQWVTWDGSYETKLVPRDVLFMQRLFREKRVPLGKATADASGRAESALTAPRDFGEVHSIFAVVESRDVARGGYRIIRRASVTPSEGPVGTPVTVEVTGIAWKPFENTMALRYDNAYTGFVSAVTTAGSATFRFRAAGPVGPHTIQLTAASAALPFLNNQQSGTAYIPNMDLRFPFRVTGDAGPPPTAEEWPSADRVALLAGDQAPRPTSSSGVSAVVEPVTATVGSEVTLRARGLPAGARVGVRWTLGGEPDPNLPPQFRSLGAPVGEATAGQDGTVAIPIRVVDDRGGWHVLKVVRDGQVQAEVPLYVRRNLAQFAPQRVRSGEEFTIELKGGGWTELDKGVAVTYDNAYVGYACSVSSAGDITIKLVATGIPGTHLIDLYPMLYRQPGEHPAEYWDFEVPQLTALDDHPGLARGYQLPIFRLAITVTE